jgi:SAM-dependent methyltransferase
MSDGNAVAEHYSRARLLAAIEAGVAALGKTPETVTVDDLAPVDEFHIAGRKASEEFLGQLELVTTDHVLDVGCGLGGASRFAADRFGCQVTGIDLTGDYVETGQVLCDWLGLTERVRLEQGSALAMPYGDASFDKAFMMHVGMNIADKEALFAEVFRVLKPRAAFGVYDVMLDTADGFTYPVPWATSAETNAIAAPADYKVALAATGFRVTAERGRRQFALDFFARDRAANAASAGPPPLGLHILMNESGADKISNLVTNIAKGRIAPVELIAQKPEPNQ